MWISADGSRSLKLSASPPAVHFLHEGSVALVGLDEIGQLLEVVERLKSAPESFDPDKLNQVATFAEHLYELVNRPTASAAFFAVDGAQRSILNLLVMQVRLAGSLESRIRRRCLTCGRETLTNPDFQKVKERNDTVKGIARDVVMGAMTGRTSSMGMLSNAFGFLDPDFVCFNCKGMRAETSLVAFCPQCRAQQDGVLITSCKKCRHDFRSDAGMHQFWVPEPEARLANSGRQLAEQALDAVLTAASWAASGNLLVTGTWTRVVQAWDLASARDGGGGARCLWSSTLAGRATKGLLSESARCGGALLALSSDGQTVAASTKETTSKEPTAIHLLSLQDGQVRGRFLTPPDLNEVHGISFAPDGRLLAVLSQKVQLWDTARGTLWHVLDAGKGAPRSSAFNQDGSLIATDQLRFTSSRVIVWRLHDGVQLGGFPLEDAAGARFLTWLHDGSLAYVQKSRIVFGEPLHGGIVATIDCEGCEIDAVSISPDAGWLAVSLRVDDGPADVRIINLTEGNEVARIPTGSPVSILAMSAHGLVAIGTEDKKVRVVDALAGTAVDGPSSVVDLSGRAEPEGGSLAPAGRQSRLVVPAWHDPKARTVVFDPSTLQVGLLSLDGQGLSFATDDGVQFAARINDAKVTWMGKAGTMMGARCDLEVDGRRHRLYFVKPIESAPDPSESRLIASASSVSGKLRDVPGATGLGLASSVMALPGAIAHDRQAKRNADAVRAWLQSWQTEPPSSASGTGRSSVLGA